MSCAASQPAAVAVQPAFVTGSHEFEGVGGAGGAHGVAHVPVVVLQAVLRVVKAWFVAQPVPVLPTRQPLHTESAIHAVSAVQHAGMPERQLSQAGVPVDSPELQIWLMPPSPPASPVPVPEPDECDDVEDELVLAELFVLEPGSLLDEECPPSTTVVVPELLLRVGGTKSREVREPQAGSAAAVILARRAVKERSGREWRDTAA
jgi:hypothetical protein